MVQFGTTLLSLSLYLWFFFNSWIILSCLLLTRLFIMVDLWFFKFWSIKCNYVPNYLIFRLFFKYFSVYLFDECAIVNNFSSSPVNFILLLAQCSQPSTSSSCQMIDSTCYHSLTYFRCLLVRVGTNYIKKIFHNRGSSLNNWHIIRPFYITTNERVVYALKEVKCNNVWLVLCQHREYRRSINDNDFC